MGTRMPFLISGHEIAPGTRATVDVPVSTLSDHTPVGLSVHVIHGKKPGPVLFVSAAVHGDEVIGVEIVRRLLKAKGLKGLAGTLLAVPIVTLGVMPQFIHLASPILPAHTAFDEGIDVVERVREVR